ncbi:MAG: hypothetical protein LBG96_16580 [Tannerella sp.]|jgi:hypothetical protein|nr:hypothetical protein [Tannerella sp.]
MEKEYIPKKENTGYIETKSEVSETGRLTPEDKKRLSDLYDNIFESLFKDEDRFETKITYIAAGGIVLFFIDIILNKMTFNSKPIGAIGAAFVITSLLSNLLSYLIGKKWMRGLSIKLEEALKNGVKPEKDPNDMVHSINRKVDYLNWFSAALLIIGTIFITIFIFINN